MLGIKTKKIYFTYNFIGGVIFTLAARWMFGKFGPESAVIGTTGSLILFFSAYFRDNKLHFKSKSLLPNFVQENLGTVNKGFAK